MNKQVLFNYALAFVFFLSPAIVLSQTVSLYPGETIRLYCPSAPIGSIDAASWSSNNKGVGVAPGNHGLYCDAYVNSYFEGTATIECYYSYSWYSTVKGRMEVDNGTVYYYIMSKPVNIRLNQTELEMKVGENYQLTYTQITTGAPDAMVTWASEDKDIASVDKEGIVHAKASGEVDIIAQNKSGNDAICHVSIERIYPTEISLSPNQMIIVEGKSEMLKYNLSPEGASAKIQWKSSNESVAEVSSSGRVTGKNYGNATITATTDNNLSATCNIEVLPLPRSVSLPNNENVKVGYTLRLKPTCSPANAVTTYSWSSDNPNIASVDANGIVKGRKEGTATITVLTANKKSATINIKVVDSTSGIDYRNAAIRIKAIKDLINQSIKSLKK